MKLKIKFYKPVFLVLGLSLVAFAVGYSTFRFVAPNALPIETKRAAEEVEDENEEISKREHGLIFRSLQLQDEKGIVAPDGLKKAKLHVEKMKKAADLKRKSEKLRPSKTARIMEAGVAPDSWTWLGPGNVGGRVRSIVIHPTDPNKMWTGSVSGGIWRTVNGGASWSPVDDFMANLAIGTMVMHPTNPNILYAGTGEGFGVDEFRFNSKIQGAGVFRSTDGGATWNQLASTDNADWIYVNRLAISPNGGTILAATASGVWRSTNSGTSWIRTDTAETFDIDFHPTDSNRAVFGGSGRARFSEDGGQTWQAADFDSFVERRIETAYAPGNGSIVYASVNRNQGELYRSEDGGETYDLVNTGTQFLGTQGGYDNVVWVNPQDEDFVIVGGIRLWRSTDGGAMLTQISSNSPESAHSDQHAIVAHPGFNNTTNKTVFFGNDGGVYRAANVATVSIASGWTELNNNLGITQFYGAAGNSTSGVIIGGTQDNGTLRYTGGTENWSETYGADGGYCAADQTDANYFYGVKQNLGVIRSSNAGQSAEFIADGITDRDDDDGCRCNFIAPIALDPNNSNRLLAGGWSLWRTNDAKAATPTWSSIKLPWQDNPISAIAVAPGDSNFIVVGHNEGDLWRTANGTNASPDWTRINTDNLPERFVTRVVIDTSRNPDWIYATFGGFSGDNVYVTRDLGANWTDITGTGASGLPDVPVRALAIHPHDRDLLYVGTEVGIFTSGNAGESWELPNGGPANVSVDELFWVGGDLIAATHGRGLYRASGGLYVDCNYNGVQIGTFSQPFKTVNAAINALTTYRPIWLKACNYNEQINTNKKIELRSLGGAATIGAP